MKSVAHHLQMEAIKQNSAIQSDLFGRSAYNRYYYATFLRTRSLFSELNSQWSNVPHATYPDLLKGSICKSIKIGRVNAQRVHDSELVTLCSQAAAAANSLSDLMRKSFAIRVVADYHPDIRCDFADGQRFKLNSVQITDAHQWPDKADTFAKTIARAWHQIHG